MNGQYDQSVPSKRRRVDHDYEDFVALPSRTAAKAAARTAHLTRERPVHVPVVDLASLRYLCRYNLLDAHGSLSYHHAVHPFPRPPAELTPPLAGRLLAKPAPDETRGKKRGWREPKTLEFADLSAHDVPDVVVERLAGRARAHWDKKDSVKEGETLTNFVFAVRMRAHTLRATPPG